MIRWFRRLWRRLNGICEVCGQAPRTTPTKEDAHSKGPFCRPCNKRMTFGTLYGGNPARFMKERSRGGE